MKIELKASKRWGEKYPTAIINGKFIHSYYDPISEAKKIVSNYNLDNVNVVFILGAGLGYVIDEIIKLKKSITIIAVEKIEFFKKFLEQKSISQNVKIFVNSDIKEIIFFLQNILVDLKNIVFIQNNNLVELSKDYYQNLKQELINFFKRGISEITTDAYFNEIWLTNTIRNLKHIKKYSFLKDYKDFYKNESAIFISSGVTLENNLDLLKDSNLIKFSLPHPVPLLMKNNIVPHFIISSDANFYNLLHFKNFIHNQDLTLITEPILNPVILKNWKGKVIFFDHNLEISFILKNVIGEIGYIPMGGTVSISALFIAKYLGFKKIYLLGQDFNIIDLKTHCKGSGYENYNLNRINKFETLLNKQFKFINESGIVSKLNIYKNWLENILPDIDIEIKNISSNHIKGIENTNFITEKRISEKIIKLKIYDIKNDIEKLLKKIKTDLVLLKSNILKLMEQGDYLRIIDFLFSSTQLLPVIKMLFYIEFLKFKRSLLKIDKELAVKILERIERFENVL